MLARNSKKLSRPARHVLSENDIARRMASVPILTYPEELPISQVREEIMEVIAQNQLVIISGQTGSGKTTQLPKICLQLGRGVRAMIGHTQPRRLAARTVAARIAEETHTDLGKQIGFQVRFVEEYSKDTLVKLMTDGVLLAEIQNDRLLSRYDTIIIDEAHERSLNIDFLLGYLHQLLPKRPDLKVIITSATIDAKRMASHFGPQVPILQVSGRTYPVEIRYRPLNFTPLTPGQIAEIYGENISKKTVEISEKNLITSDNTKIEEVEDSGFEGENKLLTTIDDLSETGYGAEEEDLDQVGAILGAVDELLENPTGDILVFLAGEKDIQDTAAALSDHLGRRYTAPGAVNKTPGALEVLPLYSRLSNAEQNRIFNPGPYRRIVLATNVAETSLTVPGIRYVIDPGLARISRFSPRTKVQRLPIEAISQASANQRAGRCGRLGPGICIRLYSPADFSARDQYTEPEILRTSLASVILQMTALKLGPIEEFPFIDAPSAAAVREGLRVLVEIGALAAKSGREGYQLTKIGYQLARLPIDPRLARMLVEADKRGCASQVLVIVAALSMQDVRERPSEFSEAADAAHARFLNEESDFLSYLQLWKYLRTQAGALSGSAFRKMCKKEYLHYLRIREWQDLVSQLRQLLKPLNIKVNPLNHDEKASVDREAIHRSLLTGLLANIGYYSQLRGGYMGAGNTSFSVWPGSGLARKRHEWVMAAELVETSRLFARTVAKISPQWVEAAAGDQVKKSYFEVFWSTKSVSAQVHEKVMFRGLTLLADRKRNLGKIGNIEIEGVPAPLLARQLFIENALVDELWPVNYKFLADNRQAVEKAKESEKRQRKTGIVADRDTLIHFFEQKLDLNITSGKEFESWWKRKREEDPQFLNYPPELLDPAGYSLEAFPDVWKTGKTILPLSYSFTPGALGQSAASVPEIFAEEGKKNRGNTDKHDNPKILKNQGNNPDRATKSKKVSRRQVDNLSLQDGISVFISSEVLEETHPEGFDWLVPGFLPELLVATTRALPKTVRKLLVPAPQFAAEARQYLAPTLAYDPGDRPSFSASFRQAAFALRGVEISEEQWHQGRKNLNSAYKMHFIVYAKNGAVLGQSDDLADLKGRLQAQAAQALQDGKHSKTGALNTAETEGKTGKNDSQTTHLVAPSTFALRKNQEKIVAEKILETLILPLKRVVTRFRGEEVLLLARNQYASTPALVQATQECVARDVLAEYLQLKEVSAEVNGKEMLSQGFIEALSFWARDSYEERVYKVLEQVIGLNRALNEFELTVKNTNSLVLIKPLREVKAQVLGLCAAGFLERTPKAYRSRLEIYVRAATIRLTKAATNLAADEAGASQMQWIEQQWRDKHDKLKQYGPSPELEKMNELFFWLQELRVQVFAQQLKTAHKVSVQRIDKALREI